MEYTYSTRKTKPKPRKYKSTESTRKSNVKKALQLGMSIGKAAAILKKNVMFVLVRNCGLDICYRCEKSINTADELSIEHKENWMNSSDPAGIFFNLDNITFSHRSCNIKASKLMPPGTPKAEHPSATMYAYGCRCEGCKVAHTEKNRKYYESKNSKRRKVK